MLTRSEVLKELGFHSMTNYLASPLWQRIEARAFLCHGPNCRLCGAIAEVIHHLGYGRAVMLGRSFHQLAPLCLECSQLVTVRKGRKLTPNQSHTAYIRLWKVVKRKIKVLSAEERKGSWGYCKRCGRKARKRTTLCRSCAKGNPVPKSTKIP